MPRPYDPYLLDSTSCQNPASSAREVKELLGQSELLRILSKPLSILIPKTGQRRSSSLITPRLAPRISQSAYLIGIDDACACVVPELLFASMGRKLSFPEQVRLGMELCGTYSEAAFSDHTAFTRYGLTPITQRASIEQFLTDNPHIYGAKPALDALEFVADGSASPMETALYLLLCLPTEQGGYGMPAPKLNADIEVTRFLKSEHAGNTVYGDLVFEECKVVIEYQSRMFHEASVDQDEERRDDIEATGYTVMFVGPSRIQDFNRFEALVKRLAHHMGKSESSLAIGPTLKRLELRKTLLPKNWTRDDCLLV